MSFEKLAKERYSQRYFSKQKVEQEKIDKILEMAIIAPTAHNMQPHKIRVVTDEMALELIDECTTSRFKAPCAIIVGYDKSACWVRKYDEANSGEIDSSIITTHMMLQAQDLGLSTLWVMHYDPFKLQEKLNIPSNVTTIAILMIGYPSESARPSKLHNKSKTLDEIIL